MDYTETDVYAKVLEKIGYKLVRLSKVNLIGNTAQIAFEKKDAGWNKQIFVHFTRNTERVVMLREKINTQKSTLLSKSIFEFTQKECFRETKIELLYDSYL